VLHLPGNRVAQQTWRPAVYQHHPLFSQAPDLISGQASISQAVGETRTPNGGTAPGILS